MRSVKKAAEHISAVVKGMLFIGFSIQIVLGLIWMCCNLAQIQDFGEPDSALYRGIFRLLGENPYLMYLIQLVAAFWAGYFLLRGLFRKLCSGAFPMEPAFTVWGSLALLTFPFAMQCHLAILPHSFMGTLFLLTVLLLAKTGRKQGWKKSLKSIAMAVVCIGLMAALSGVADADKHDMPGRSLEGMLAGRIAWPTLWVDHENWPEDLQIMVSDVLLESTYYPNNMKMLQAAIEGQAGSENAKEYYRKMIQVSWDNHFPVLIRQIGWDVLGYAVTPVIIPLQLQGKAYDSYTGRNYEIMRGNAPVLTRNYVEYACWWFVCSLVLAAIAVLANAAVRPGAPKGIKWKGFFASAAIGIFLSGVLIAVLTIRGAGVMDYKCTIAVNELWLVLVLLPMRVPVRALQDGYCVGEGQDDKGKR